MSRKLLSVVLIPLVAGACGGPAADASADPSAQAGVAPGPGYHLLATIPVGSEGGWDYLSEDLEARRLYVSHATKVVVVDMDRNTVVGEIDSLQIGRAHV